MLRLKTKNENNKDSKIEKSDNKRRIELELEDKGKTLTQDSDIDDLRTKNDDVTENLQFGGSDNLDGKKNTEFKSNGEKEDGKAKAGKKDNKINEPEENLGIVARYLKNYCPKIFKFINAVRRFFSKNKFKHDDRINFGNAFGETNLKQSLINKTLDLSSQENVRNNPNNMENQSVNRVLQ